MANTSNNPGPVTGLSKADVKTIQETWSPVYKSAEMYGVEIFKRLFRADPEIKKRFKYLQNLDETGISECTEFKVHAYSVMSAIHMMISKLDEPKSVVIMVERLGGTHKKRGIPQEYFLKLQDILVNFLQADLKLKPAQVESWGRFLGFIYPILFGALDKA